MSNKSSKYVEMEERDKPAFPQMIKSDGSFYFVGLNKREYFAGEAMKGLLANPNIYSKTDFGGIVAGIKGGWDIVICASILSDRLLAQLDKKDAKK